MMTILLPFLVALIGGIAGALQAPFAGMIGRALGDLQSVLITYCVGAIVVVLVTLLIQGGMHMETWRGVPWYVFLSGPLGLIIVGSFSFTVPRLGVSTATMVFVAASLALGAVFGATRPCGPTGIGGCDAFMKLCLSSSGCESRPAKGEPARVGSKPCASSRNGVGDA